MVRQLLPRHVLSVSGRDSFAFLDSLLTNTVAPRPGPSYGALLTAQGKLIADLILWPADNGLLLDVAQSRAAEVLSRLRQYKLRSAVEIEDVSAQVVVEAWDAPGDEPDGGAADPRLATLPRRKLAPPTGPIPAAEPAPYRAARVALGVPDLSFDSAPEELFGLEGLLEELHGVDFHKGCFIGQENVSRMKRRATTRRKLCRVRFEGPPPDFGAEISDGAVALGSVRSVGDGTAIALLRLDRVLESLAAGRSLLTPSGPVWLYAPDWMLLPEAGSAETS